MPEQGLSLLPVLRGEALPARALYVGHESNRMMREGKWKLVTKNFELADHLSPANQKKFCDLAVNPGESRNVAEQQPDTVESMVKEWDARAAKVGVPPGHRFQAGMDAADDGD